MKFDNIELLHEMIEQGYVSKRDHPVMPISIYKYTAKAQYDRVWNEVTLNMRGVVLDSEYNYITRPFSKFFNYTEPEAINNRPDLPFKVFPKMDGSLISVTTYNGTLLVTSSGSFTSTHVSWAQQILIQKKVKFILNKRFENKTFLFELIHPANRIVVNYGGESELHLLAVLNNETQVDETYRHITWARHKDIPVVLPIEHTYTDETDYLENLQKLNVENEEGYVVVYSNGFREKIKFENYVEKHRIHTQLSTKSVYKAWCDNTPLDKFIEELPDEWYPWIKRVYNGLETRRINIYNRVYTLMKESPILLEHVKDKEDRKTIALYIQKNADKDIAKYCYMYLSSLDRGWSDNDLYTNIVEAIKKDLEPDYALVSLEERSEVFTEEETDIKGKKDVYVIFTVGLPASGKSTWAREFVSKDNTYFNFNLDDLRKMSGAGTLPSYTKERDYVAFNMMKSGIYHALSSKYNVVVSNTNLQANTVSNIQKSCLSAKGVNVFFLFKSFLDVPFEVCLQRNQNRPQEDFVPFEAMERMNNLITK